ncbi:MAG: hypothetical protein AB7K68_02710 [Bacteriovoracia bacterium]
MQTLYFLLLSIPAFADGQLLVSGNVVPAIDFGFEPFNDGYAIRNLGNSVALFQIGARDKQGRQVAWLRQSEQLLLRTDYLQKTGGPIEIRILAP